MPRRAAGEQLRNIRRNLEVCTASQSQQFRFPLVDVYDAI